MTEPHVSMFKATSVKLDVSPEVVEGGHSFRSWDENPDEDGLITVEVEAEKTHFRVRGDKFVFKSATWFPDVHDDFTMAKVRLDHVPTGHRYEAVFDIPDHTTLKDLVRLVDSGGFEPLEVGGHVE